MFGNWLCRISNPLFRQTERKNTEDKIDKGLIALKSSIVLLIISRQAACQKFEFYRIKNGRIFHRPFQFSLPK